jgi:cell division initiation protein
MSLSPAEIQHQTLRGRRGSYRREDVDDLLERVVASYEDVWLERDQLVKHAEELAEELGTYKEMEQVFRDSLIAGHRTADELRAEAAREAEEIVADAKRRAEGLLEEARGERDKLEDEIGRLRSLSKETQERCRSLLVEVLSVLEPKDEDVDAALGRDDGNSAKPPLDLDTADWEIPSALTGGEQPEALVEASEGRSRRRGR